MAFKLVTDKQKQYNEMGQANPLRWKIVKPVDGGYKAISGWWKCKDFLNDYLFTQQTGQTTSIYAFEITKEDIPEDKRLYLLLNYVVKEWFTNMVLVNEWVAEKGFPYMEFEKLPDGKAFLKITEEYLDNTFVISAISLLIRVVNTPVIIEDLKKFMPVDQPKEDALLKTLWSKEEMFKKQPYIFSWGTPERSWPKEGAPPAIEVWQLKDLIHNCGLSSWKDVA